MAGRDGPPGSPGVRGEPGEAGSIGYPAFAGHIVSTFYFSISAFVFILDLCSSKLYAVGLALLVLE